MPLGKPEVLNPVIALHGKSGNTDMMLDARVEGALAQLIKAGRDRRSPWSA
ncbi:hypothetical protein [Mycobacterium uberis]|uniref:hypothetical protein n=1 Tax=Mycobacterium uberis TaxID=2162698 RepID=UPI001FB26D1D|nr:hypothetical protein [Mycobacterium uberis]